MNDFHQMLPEDEILLCGLTLLLGVVSGLLARLVVAVRERRTA